MRFLAPLVDQHLKGGGEAAEAEALYRPCDPGSNPGYIRVDADEVTYPAHVMLRYRLERALIAGELAVDEISRRLGRDPRGAARAQARRTTQQGCLQDIHWSVGELGYFPSYTVGALMAAQFFDAAARDEPELWPAIERGDFAPLLGWLRANVTASPHATRVRRCWSARPARRLAPRSSRPTCSGAIWANPASLTRVTAMALVRNAG